MIISSQFLKAGLKRRLKTVGDANLSVWYIKFFKTNKSKEITLELHEDLDSDYFLIFVNSEYAGRTNRIGLVNKFKNALSELE